MANTCCQLPDFQSFKDTFGKSSANDFTVVNANVRSLRKHWEQFKLVAISGTGFVDAFVLTEINASEACMRTFSIPGYLCRFLTRLHRRGGGIAIFVRDIFDVSPIDMKFAHAECLALKLTCSARCINLLALYRPPCASATRFLLELEERLHLWNSVEELYLVGDLNINTLCPTKGIVCDYLSLLSSYGLTNTVTIPTREEIVNDHLTTSCIDHIAVRAPNYSVASCVIVQRIADHYLVACRSSPVFPLSPAPRSATPNNVVYITVADNTVLDGLINSFDWSAIIESNSPEQVYTLLCNQIKKFEDSSKRTVIKKRRREFNWLTADVMRAISYRDLLWRRCKHAPKNKNLRLDYKAARNRVVALIRFTKRQFFFEKFRQSSKSAGGTWKLINHLRGKNPANSSPLSFFPGDPTEVANRFNHFYALSSENASSRQTHQCTLKESNLVSAFLPRITKHELSEILFSFKRTKPPGIDGLSANLLQRNFEALSDVLIFIVNGFLDSARFPDELKTAVVKPLFKGGQKDDMKNYRPISILPILSHIIEKFLLKVMSSFVEKFSIISTRQFGFVPGRSTIALLEEFSDELFAAFDQNLFSVALFLDVSKAFETVHHSILLEKLYSMGFRGPFYEVLKNYLSGRSQVVVIDGMTTASSKLSLKAGVPQGSILSPMLFNLFVNDLPQAISKGILFQYADDTVLLSKHISYNKAITALQDNIHKTMLWFTDNCLEVNPVKTKLVCFRSPLKLTAIDAPVFLHIQNCFPCRCIPVSYVNSLKYLGVFFDSDMSWHSQLSHVCDKLRSAAWLFFHIRSIVPFHVKKTITHGLVYSILRYGITIFAFCSARWQSRVDSLLRNILKNVAYNAPFPTTDNIFTDLGLPCFRTLFLQTAVIRNFRDSDFKIRHTASRSLRSTIRFVVPRSSTKFGEARRCVYVPRIFNDLPDEAFSAASKKALKTLVSLL